MITLCASKTLFLTIWRGHHCVLHDCSHILPVLPPIEIRKQERKYSMEITYTEEKKFTQDEVQRLFLSVGWVSGQYPARLYKALMNSSTVITAWDKKHLVGLVRLIDDSELVAYMHYVLVDPAYHGLGIASTMILMVKEKYKNYLYIEIMPEESKNVSFYERHGFQVMSDGVAMQLCNFADKR